MRMGAEATLKTALTGGSIKPDGLAPIGMPGGGADSRPSCGRLHTSGQRAADVHAFIVTPNRETLQIGAAM